MQEPGVTVAGLAKQKDPAGFRRWRSSLQARMLLGFGLLGAGILTALELVHLYGLPFTGFGGEYGEHRELALRQLNVVADLKKERLLHWLDSRTDDARVLAESAFFKAAVEELATAFHDRNDPRPPVEWIRSELAQQPIHRAVTHELLLAHNNSDPYASVEIADAATGLILASSHAADVGHSVAGQAAFTNAFGVGARGLLGMEKDPESGKLSLLISRVIRGTGKDHAVLIMRLSPAASIFPHLQIRGELGQTGEAVLLDQNRLLLAPLAHPLQDGSRAEPLATVVASPLALLAVRGQDGLAATTDYRGAQVMAAFRHVQVSPALQWVLVLKQEQSEVFKDLWRSMLFTLWIELAGLGVLLVMSYSVARALARPVKRLNRAVQQVAAGNLEARAPASLPGELGLLAQTFNTMVERVQRWHSELQAAVEARTADLEQSNTQLRRERDNFRRVMDSMQDGVYAVNRNYEVQYLNPALEKEFGPVGQRKCYEYFHERRQFCPWCKNAEVWQGKSVRWEWASTRNGRTYDLLDTPLVNEDGSISKLEIFRDITARKQAEEALVEAQDRFQTVADFTYDWEYWRAPDGQFVYMSPSCERITGYTREEFLREPGLLLRIIYPDDRPRFEAHLVTCEEGTAESPCELEFRILRRDGQEGWIGHGCQAVQDPQGRYRGRRASNRDITERKRAEQVLARTSRRLKLLSETVSALLVSESPDHVVEQVCTAVMQHLDCQVFMGFLPDDTGAGLRLSASAGVPLETARQLECLPWTQVVDGCACREDERVVSECIAGPGDPRLVAARSLGVRGYACWRLSTLDGRVLGTLSFGTRTRDAFTADEQSLMKAVAYHVAIALERRRAAQALAQSVSLLHATVESTADGLLVVDQQGKVVTANQKFVQMWAIDPCLMEEGTDEHLLVSVLDQLKDPPGFLEGVRKLYAQPEAESFDTLELRDGRVFERYSQPQRLRGECVGRVWSFRDVTARHQAESGLRKAWTEMEQRVIERTADLRAANLALQVAMAERKTLETRILEISEREQRRIGQDLHDGVCQQLTGIAHLCSVAHQRMLKLAPDQADVGARTVELVQDTIEQAHNLARGLFPVSGEAGGLMVALDQLVGKFRKFSPCSLRFVCEGKVLVEDNATATHLYRIAQEALGNAFKHAQATEIVVRLAASPQVLRLSVTDNGRGFPATSAETASPGLGLETMRCRARSVGAQLVVSRGGSGGTTVSCELPRNSLPSSGEDI